MMYRDPNEEARTQRRKRRLMAKIKCDERQLQAHPYVYRSCITREDKKFMLRNFMLGTYSSMIKDREHFIPVVKEYKNINYSGWSSRATYAKKKCYEILEAKRMMNISK